MAKKQIRQNEEIESEVSSGKSLPKQNLYGKLKKLFVRKSLLRPKLLK
jgi:hypothetical protein